MISSPPVTTPRPARRSRSTPSGRPAAPPIGTRLRTEWLAIATDPVSIRHAAGWMIVDGPLLSLDQVLAATGFGRTPSHHTDAAMRRLVEAASGGDGLAARVAIQRILPGLIAVAVRRAGQAESPLDEVIGAAWIAVRTFNPRRRPACIAAALISDVDYLAFRQRWRRAERLSEHPAGTFEDVVLAHLDPPPSARDELVGLLDQALAAGVPEAEVGLLQQIADDISTTQLAATHAVTERTIRNRRDRAIIQLRQLASAA